MTKLYGLRFEGMYLTADRNFLEWVKDFDRALLLTDTQAGMLQRLYPLSTIHYGGLR